MKLNIKIDDEGRIWLDGKEISPMAYHPYGGGVAGPGAVSKPKGKREDSFSFATLDDGWPDAPIYIFTVEELSEHPRLLKKCVEGFLNDLHASKENKIYLSEIQKKVGI